MTRQDFLDNVTTWDGLIDFCNEIGYDVDEIYSEDARNDYIEDDIAELVRDVTWREVLTALENYDSISGYDWYLRDDWGEWTGLEDGDAEFDNYKENVEEWAAENDCFDDAEDEDEEDEESDRAEPLGYDPDTGEVFVGVCPPSDCSIDDLMNDSAACVTAVREEALEQARENDRLFANLCELGA